MNGTARGPRYELSPLPDRLAVCRLPADAPLPAPSENGFFSVTRTEAEISIVCREGDEPGGAAVEPGWRALRVAGTLDFSQTGVLASFASPLAQAGVPIFVVSTYDTDYLLVQETDLDTAVTALTAAGHSVAG